MSLNKLDAARIGAPGRLGLIAGEPVHVPDSHTISTTIRYNLMPGTDRRLFLLNADGAWESLEITVDQSFPQTPPTANKLHSIWLYNNSGTLALAKDEWTSDTVIGASAAWTEVDGVRVKNTDNTRRLAGVMRTQSSQNFIIGGAMNGIWNCNNKIPRRITIHNQAGSHTYNVANTWRDYNNGAGNTVDSTWGLTNVGIVCGEREPFVVDAQNTVFSDTANGSVRLGIRYASAAGGFDDMGRTNSNANWPEHVSVQHSDTGTVGYSQIHLTERISSGTVGSFDHGFLGMHGFVWG